MNEQQAREILGDYDKHEGWFTNISEYVEWLPQNEKAALDGEFTADQLEAIAFWMRTYGAK